jgi:hypothetical protein
MGKEMEQGLLQMMECLLDKMEEFQRTQIAGLAEMKSDLNVKIEAGQEEIKAWQEKVDAEADACQDQFIEDIK